MSDRVYIGVLFAIAAAVAAIFYITAPAPPTSPARPAPDDAPVDAPVDASSPPAAQRDDTAPSAPSDSIEPQRVTPDAGQAEATARAMLAPDRPVASPDAGIVTVAAVAPVDMGTAAPSWTDPVNARVLGRPDWMAPVDEAEKARIDEIFEKSRAARYDPHLSNRDRATSITVAQKIVDACFDALSGRQPGIQGRLIVAWTASASEGRGTIRDPRIKVNYHLEDPTFEACILDGLANRSFPAADGDPIEVEAPFFYDGAY